MFTLSALKQDGFTWQSALSLAFASKLTYQPESTILSAAADWGFLNTEVIDVGDTQGFAATTDEVVLIAFRGTESLGDWLGNLQLHSATHSHGFAHSGFLNAYTEIREIVRRVAEAGGSPTRKLRLTGHSLGGALATLAAADLADFKIHGDVYTYGQPRVGDPTFQQFMNAQFSNRFFRFVNDDDLVTRVPPGYRHVGLLKHFDAYGELRAPMATEEIVTASVEEPELSEAEFERVQQIIRFRQDARRRELIEFPSAEANANADAGLEGLIPGLKDHAIDRYIAAIGRHAGDSALDAALYLEEAYQPLPRNEWEAVFTATRSLGLEGLEAAPSPPTEVEKANSEIAFAKQSRQQIPLLIRLRDVNWQAPPDLLINSRFGTFVSAIVSKSELQLLKNDPGIASIDLSRDAGIEELAVSVPFVKADAVQRPPIGETGDSALIGVIDSGIDVLHEAFLGDDGKSRILAVWNQRDSNGPAPRQIDPAFTQVTGTMYTAADIDKFISGAVPTPPALRDPSAHGTHVASIAAGRAAGSLANGMAPQARLVVVIPNMTTRPGDAPSLGYSLSHIDALNFLKLVSQGNNTILANALPMAVNVSLGMNAGAHDGTSSLEAAFDSITGSGRDEGFVIVKSAGNERGQAGHTRVQAANGKVLIEWNSDGGQPQDYMEAWYSPFDVLEFALVDPGGNRSAFVTEKGAPVGQVLGGNLCQLRVDPIHRDNGHKQLVIAITPQTAPIQFGKWTLEIVGTKLASSDRRVDLWVERDNSRAVHFLIDVPQITLSIPGTANTVITVAACDTSTPLNLTTSSSFGLTRNGQEKPDICAPGQDIQAALSNVADRKAVTKMTGTSMAAPHVTGALALVLSHRHKSDQPQYNARQLRTALAQTAKDFDGRHHEGFGFGMLDAFKLFEALS